VRRTNDVRFLDTSFFPSAVALVSPKRRGSTYVLEITLRQRVPFQQKVEGDMLAIDFERPPGLRPATGSPGAPAPAEPAVGEGEGTAPVPAAPAPEGK
jgi:hypothetical protein